MTEYLVVVRREDDVWVADVPGVNAHTFAPTLPALDRNVREAVALAVDLPATAEADLALTYDYRLGDADLEFLTAALRTERARLAAAERELARRTATAARTLVDRFTVRDTATLLGISPQRVSQVAPRPRTET